MQNQPLGTNSDENRAVSQNLARLQARHGVAAWSCSKSEAPSKRSQQRKMERDRTSNSSSISRLLPRPPDIRLLQKGIEVVFCPHGLPIHLQLQSCMRGTVALFLQKSLRTQITRLDSLHQVFKLWRLCQASCTLSCMFRL